MKIFNNLTLGLAAILVAVFSHVAQADVTEPDFGRYELPLYHVPCSESLRGMDMVRQCFSRDWNINHDILMELIESHVPSVEHRLSDISDDLVTAEMQKSAHTFRRLSQERQQQEALLVFHTGAAEVVWSDNPVLAAEHLSALFALLQKRFTILQEWDANEVLSWAKQRGGLVYSFTQDESKNRMRFVDWLSEYRDSSVAPILIQARDLSS